MSHFTPSASYALATHTIRFNKTGVQVFLTLTDTLVDGARFSDGFSIKVTNGDFCFGTITFQDSFNVNISLKARSGGFEFEEIGPLAYVIGSDELDIPQVTKHRYNINTCPIRLKGNSNTVTVKCPCTTSGTPCTNTCYTKT